MLTDGFSHVGHLAVEGNHVNNAALDVERPDVTISSNIVTGGTGMGITCGYPDEPTKAPITIQSNKLSGTGKGLRYRCSTPIQATLANNTITGGKQYGIFVDAGLATLRANNVQMNGQRGIDVNCRGDAPKGSLELDDNLVSGNKTGITVTCGAPAVATTLDDNTVTDNRGNGITVDRSAGGATISGGKVQGNHGVGIAISPIAHASLSRVATGGNSGPGIASIAVQPPALTYGDQAVHGTTCAGCLVQAFELESGARQGNPHNGEGAAYVGAVQADAAGRFVYPATCEHALQLTFTTTNGTGPQADTSGFSSDVVCAAIETYHYAVHISVKGATAQWSTIDPESGYRDGGSVKASWEVTVPDLAITVDASQKSACSCEKAADGAAPQYPVTGAIMGTLTQSGKVALGTINTACSWKLDTTKPEPTVIYFVGGDVAAGKPSTVAHGYGNSGELAVDVLPQGYAPVLMSCHTGSTAPSTLVPAQVFLGTDGCYGATADVFTPFSIPVADLGKATIKLRNSPFPADTAGCALRGFDLTGRGESAHFSGSYDVTLTMLHSSP